MKLDKNQLQINALDERCATILSEILHSIRTDKVVDYQREFRSLAIGFEDPQVNVFFEAFKTIHFARSGTIEPSKIKFLIRYLQNLAYSNYYWELLRLETLSELHYLNGDFSLSLELLELSFNFLKSISPQRYIKVKLVYARRSHELFGELSTDVRYLWSDLLIEAKPIDQEVYEEALSKLAWIV